MTDISEVTLGEYLSPSGILFEVKNIAKHGQDCSHSMVVYQNLEPTSDYPAGHTWVISERLFIKLFKENLHD